MNSESANVDIAALAGICTMFTDMVIDYLPSLRCTLGRSGKYASESSCAQTCIEFKGMAHNSSEVFFTNIKGNFVRFHHNGGNG